MTSISAATADLNTHGVAYAPQIATAAARHGLDPRLLAAVAAQETGGPGTNAGANVDGDGGHGHGLFQIDDRYHSFARSAAAEDPADNADYAAGMLRGLLDRYGGNVHEALSAYNAGDPNATGTTTHWADGQVLGYADSVMRHYRDVGGSAGSTAVQSAGAAPAAAAAESDVAANPDYLAFVEEAIAERGSTFAGINSLSSFRSSTLQPQQSTMQDPFTGLIDGDDSDN